MFIKETDKASSDSEAQQNDKKEKDKFSFALPTGFTPPALESDPRPTRHSPPSPLLVQHPYSTLFESCQAELIDLQDRYKKDMLTLKEVEDKFEEWKRRPELEIAR